MAVDLTISPHVILVLKSRIKWAEHVAVWGREEYRGHWQGNLKKKVSLKS